VYGRAQQNGRIEEERKLWLGEPSNNRSYHADDLRVDTVFEMQEGMRLGGMFMNFQKSVAQLDRSAEVCSIPLEDHIERLLGSRAGNQSLRSLDTAIDKKESCAC